MKTIIKFYPNNITDVALEIIIEGKLSESECERIILNKYGSLAYVVDLTYKP